MTALSGWETCLPVLNPWNPWLNIRAHGKMNHIRNITRRTTRRLVRPLSRCLTRSCLRRAIPRRRGADELSQALTAFSRATRCHRKLAKLAPRFFDFAVVDREKQDRAEQKRWMAIWNPIINKAYGLDPNTPEPPDPNDGPPPLPSLRVQRIVDQELAALETWMEAGRLAMQTHHERHPHSIPSLSQIARLLQIGIDFGKVACGLDSKKPLPPPIKYDEASILADIERAYPQKADPIDPPPAPVEAAVVQPTEPPKPIWPPHDDKRDLVPYEMVIGEHGLLCLKRVESESF